MRAPSRLDSYTTSRPDVIALVPESARHILDVGCATGQLGAEIKRLRSAKVVGIEIDPAFANEAQAHLDRVVVGRAEDAAGLLEGECFDTIVCADVLEHLADPEETLRSLGSLLSNFGRIVVSLPNVRFYDTFVQLGIRGTWPMRDRGVHDRTHLRWFTDRDARAMFLRSGFEVEEAATNYRVVERPSRYNRIAQLVARGPLRGFLAYQHLYRLMER